MNIKQLVIAPIFAALAGIIAIAVVSFSAIHFNKQNTIIITQTIENSNLAVDTQKAFFRLKFLVDNHHTNIEHNHYDEIEEFRNYESQLNHLLSLLYLSENIDEETRKKGETIADELNLLIEQWLESSFQHLTSEEFIEATERNLLKQQTYIIEEKLTELFSLIGYSLIYTTQKQEKTYEILSKGTLLITLLIFIFSVLWTFYYSKRIIDNLIALVSSMNQLNTGQTNIEIPFTDIRGDIGDIARTTNLFKDKLIELKKTNEDIAYIANHDPLTGIANRRFLDKEFSNLINHSKNSLYLFHIDLDNFKDMNDFYGHSMGDQILVCITESIKKILNKEDFIARIGGDEFIVLVDFNEAPKEEINVFAEQLIKAINKPIEFSNKIVNMNGSCGVAKYPDDGTSLEVLMKHADMALYEAKRTSRNGYIQITEGLKNQAKNKDLTLKELERGVSNNEIIPFFQPQYCINSHNIVGFEALARWVHPEKGILSPAYFIEEASSTELIEKIGSSILDSAITALQSWDKQGFPQVSISINVSHRELANPNFYDNIVRKLSENNIDSSRIALEVLETVAIDNNNKFILQNLCRLYRYGINLDVDDFGVGYSSISSLQKSNFQRIKIDRSFACTEVDSEKDKILFQSMIHLASSLQVESLVEGIETQAQLALAKKYGCNIIQGYLIAKPMNFDDITQWWETAIENSFENILPHAIDNQTGDNEAINLSEPE